MALLQILASLASASVAADIDAASATSTGGCWNCWGGGDTYNSRQFFGKSGFINSFR